MDRRMLIFKKLSSSDKAFIGIVLAMLIAKAAWAFAGVDHPLVKLWTASWTAMILVAIIAGLVYPLSKKIGMPAVLDEKVSNIQRYVIPVILGVIFSLFEVVFGIIQELPKEIHVSLPFSVPVYAAGGIFLEFLYHFIPVVFLTWLVSHIILKGAHRDKVFWIFALLLSLWEPLMQVAGLGSMGMLSGPAIAVFLFLIIFSGNIIPFALLGRYGLLAPIIFRLSDYLIWHVLFPLL